MSRPTTAASNKKLRRPGTFNSRPGTSNSLATTFTPSAIMLHSRLNSTINPCEISSEEKETEKAFIAIG